MAQPLFQQPFCVFALVALFSLLLNSCYGWSPAGATWYGSPTGAGSDGGACGYGNLVEQPPFSSLVSAGGPSLFKSGIGCGACYQVKCTATQNAACSGNPVSVVISDECPGGPCTSESVHFDLSGYAFGAMATSGQGNQLRNAGVLQIEYERVECNYNGRTIDFRVDSGSNPYYFASLIVYANGDGELGSVELKHALDPNTWIPMQHSWGAVWSLSPGFMLQAPFSIRLTALESGDTVVASNVIPVGWIPGQTYSSLVNFNV